MASSAFFCAGLSGESSSPGVRALRTQSTSRSLQSPRVFRIVFEDVLSLSRVGAEVEELEGGVWIGE